MCEEALTHSRARSRTLCLVTPGRMRPLSRGAVINSFSENERANLSESKIGVNLSESKIGVNFKVKVCKFK